MTVIARLCLMALAGLLSVLAEDLPSRYKRLSCAVIQVQSQSETGTAFFVNNTGRLATVAHVLYDEKYRLLAGQVTADPSVKPGLRIGFPIGTTTDLKVPAPEPNTKKQALFDIAVIETGLNTPCFIPLGNADSVVVGQHLIAIGFPGGSTSEVLYEGFLSARAARLPLPFGAIEGRPDLSYAPRYEVLRVQMPITPGTSGSPIITDSNEVVGIVSEAPIILTRDVQRIAATFGNLKNVSSGLLLSGFDVTKTLGELAWTVQQFETPGAGLAVPVSYLNPPDFLHIPSPRPGATIPPKSRSIARQSQ
jgi:S1-C subfamily serine protease